jgi:hypothetical protein
MDGRRAELTETPEDKSRKEGIKMKKTRDAKKVSSDHIKVDAQHLKKGGE